MNSRSFIRRLCRSSITPHTAVVLIMLVELAWSGPSFSAENHEAAKNGNLAKVQVLLRQNPDLVPSKDKDGQTPLHWATASG
jgi:hypothetical protein